MPGNKEMFQPPDFHSAPDDSDAGKGLERSSLGALYQVISLDDEEFRVHLENTARLSLDLAIAEQLDRPEQERIWYAGLLHDIGKVGIDRKILSKVGLLAPEEVEEVRRHTRIGHEILCTVPGQIYPFAASVALSHHERWDGRGYPDGLAGDQIPRAARIVAIADVFDCITAGRPYRKARSHDEASEELNHFSGSQFDPTLVDRFLSEVLPNVPAG